MLYAEEKEQFDLNFSGNLGEKAEAFRGLGVVMSDISTFLIVTLNAVCDQIFIIRDMGLIIPTKM